MIANGTFWIPYWDFLNTFFVSEWDFLNTSEIKWEKSRRSFLISKIGHFEYFYRTLRAYSWDFFLRKGWFYHDLLNSGKVKWMQMGLFEYYWKSIISSNDIHIFS